MKKEVINLEVAESSVDADSLGGYVPDDSPRYHLFCFKHTHEGDYQEAIGTYVWCVHVCMYVCTYASNTHMRETIRKQ